MRGWNSIRKSIIRKLRIRKTENSQTVEALHLIIYAFIMELYVLGIKTSFFLKNYRQNCKSLRHFLYFCIYFYFYGSFIALSHFSIISFAFFAIIVRVKMRKISISALYLRFIRLFKETSYKINYFLCKIFYVLNYINM